MLRVALAVAAAAVVLLARPCASCEVSVVVRSGDTVRGLVTEYADLVNCLCWDTTCGGCPTPQQVTEQVELVAQWNQISNFSLVYVGMQLCLTDPSLPAPQRSADFDAFSCKFSWVVSDLGACFAQGGCTQFLGYLWDAMAEFGITTTAQQAAFTTSVMHSSLGLSNFGTDIFGRVGALKVPTLQLIQACEAIPDLQDALRARLRAQESNCATSTLPCSQCSSELAPLVQQPRFAFRVAAWYFAVGAGTQWSCSNMLAIADEGLGAPSNSGWGTGYYHIASCLNGSPVSDLGTRYPFYVASTCGLGTASCASLPSVCGGSPTSASPSPSAAVSRAPNASPTGAVAGSDTDADTDTNSDSDSDSDAGGSGDDSMDKVLDFAQTPAFIGIAIGAALCLCCVVHRMRQGSGDVRPNLDDLESPARPRLAPVPVTTPVAIATQPVDLDEPQKRNKRRVRKSEKEDRHGHRSGGGGSLVSPQARASEMARFPVPAVQPSVRASIQSSHYSDYSYGGPVSESSHRHNNGHSRSRGY